MDNDTNENICPFKFSAIKRKPGEKGPLLQDQLDRILEHHVEEIMRGIAFKESKFKDFVAKHFQSLFDEKGKAIAPKDFWRDLHFPEIKHSFVSDLETLIGMTKIKYRGYNTVPNERDRNRIKREKIIINHLSKASKHLELQSYEVAVGAWPFIRDQFNFRIESLKTEIENAFFETNRIYCEVDNEKKALVESALLRKELAKIFREYGLKRKKTTWPSNEGNITLFHSILFIVTSAAHQKNENRTKVIKSIYFPELS